MMSFIKTGDPNGEGLPEWRRNENSSDVLELGDEVLMISERKHALFDVLDKMQGWTEQ